MSVLIMSRLVNWATIISLIVVVVVDASVDGVDFYGYDLDGETETDSEEPCMYDARRDVPARRLDKCLEHVKRSASDTGLYWFGERWKTTCTSPSSRSNGGGANAVSACS